VSESAVAAAVFLLVPGFFGVFVACEAEALWKRVCGFLLAVFCGAPALMRLWVLAVMG
jgi:hypothetical protein